MICNYCQHLHEISFNGLRNTSEEQLINFGNKCGNQLQVISLYGKCDLIKPLFAFTPNLKSANFQYECENVLHFGEQVLTKLQKMDTKVCDLQTVIPFTDKYQDYIKDITIYSNCVYGSIGMTWMRFWFKTTDKIGRASCRERVFLSV